MTSKKQTPSDELDIDKWKLDFQTWICPKCCDDHRQDGPCSPINNSVFMPSESDNSHIANEYRRAQAEITRLKEVISYLPKVPTQPYEKELAQELNKYKKLCEMMREALDKSIKQGYGAQGYIEESDWNGLSDYYASIISNRENDARKAIATYDAAINPKPNLNDNPESEEEAW